MERKEAPTGKDTMALIERAARIVARKMHGRTHVAGRAPIDFAMDAWVYNQERGLSQGYLNTRALWMLTDALRRVYGETRKKGRKRTYQRLCFSEHQDFFVEHRHPWMDELPDMPNMPANARLIFRMLSQGFKQKDAAEVLGVTESRVSQLVIEWKSRVAEAVKRYTER